MSPQISTKCLLCARQSREDAKKRDCWDGHKCDSRRSHYRNRDKRNLVRRQKSQAQRSPDLQIRPELTGQQPAAFLTFYREAVDKPIHAVRAELWIQQKQVVTTEPIHCFGMTPSQINTVLVQILHSFSEYCEQAVKAFQPHPVNLHPQLCPLRPCPLHPTNETEFS